VVSVLFGPVLRCVFEMENHDKNVVDIVVKAILANIMFEEPETKAPDQRKKTSGSFTSFGNASERKNSVPFDSK
jgi:hypothetical protein